jgi:ZIP family zinc transporter
MSALGLIIHSTIDGASIAAAALISWRAGVVVAVGIIVHDVTGGLNTILLVTRGGSPEKKDFAFLAADALAPIWAERSLFSPPCLRTTLRSFSE